MNPASDPSIPKYLQRTTEDFYSDDVDVRMKFRMFTSIVSEHIRQALAEFEAKLTTGYGGHCLLWVGGSQAWHTWVESFPDLAPTRLEASAVTPGNWDVFIVCDSEEVRNKVACMVCSLMQKVRAMLYEMFESFSDPGYSAKDVWIGINCHKDGKQCTLKDEVGGVLFGGIVEMLQVKNKRPDKVFPYKEKEIVYVEIATVTNLDLAAFAREYTVRVDGLNFLQGYGLLTMSKYIPTQSRRHKGFDVDFYREMLAERIANLSHTTLEKIWNVVYDKYNAIIAPSSAHRKKVLNTIIERLVETLSASQMKVWETEFAAGMINVLRPTINRAIIAMTQQVRQATENRGQMFLVGGDAMRRYDVDISTTADIDTKVYILKDDFRRYKDVVHKRLQIELQKLAVYLMNTKPESSSPHRFQHGRVSADVISFVDKNTSLQFRMRFIERSDAFPVDLYSIDFRSYWKFSIEGASGEWQKKVDIPILDVVVQDVDKLAEITVIDGMPVASLAMLRGDIENTYRRKELSEGRFWGRKHKKDLARYMRLLKLPAGTVDQRARFLNFVNNDYDTYFKDGRDITAAVTSTAYGKAWKKVMYGRPGASKHKLPFGLHDLQQLIAASEGVDEKREVRRLVN